MTSGTTYTLKEIFSGDNDKVVIPDLQRDYCWGNVDLNLVGQFVESLLDMDKSKPITMGLLYGYYNQFTPEHLQLCDGQQRLTTLFLIIGVLNRKLGENKLQNFLISDFELHSDDKEPYLQYAIRESSLYFLSDLTQFYFLENTLKTVDEIEKQPWFLSNYHLDPTINSVLNAIRTIELLLDDKNMSILEDLALFILTKLEFLFFNMDSRENGEETFVIINTTGEPLSATQNLKPLIIEHNYKSNSSIANIWEKMETWFWRNRRKDAEQPHTADEGMACFFNIVRILNSKSEKEAYLAIENESKFPYKSISFDDIYQTFLIYKRLYEMDFSERKDINIEYPTRQKFFTQERLYAICPTICYCLSFPKADNENVKRIYHLFSNIARYHRPVTRTKDDEMLRSPLYRAMSLVKEMESDDILSLRVKLRDRHEEEFAKLNMIAAESENDTSRKSIELLIAEAESSKILNGRVIELIKWSESDPNKFAYYWTRFKSIWHADNDMDLVRRALLTHSFEEYPISRKGYGNLLSFCNNNEDWYDFLLKNKKSLKSFLDNTQTLDERISSFSETSDKMYMLVKNSKWMRMSEYKNVYIYGNIIALMRKERITSDYWIIYHNVSYDKNLINKYRDNWTAIWANENCIYSDSCQYNLTLESFMSNEGYRMVLWVGKHPEKESYPFYDQFDKIGFLLDSDNRWASPLIYDGEKAKLKYIEIAKIIDDAQPL